jgi:aminobenzoyl-glutamate transport protein
MAETKQTFMTRAFKGIEKAGNALPHPATLFAIFAAAALVFSWIFSMLGTQVIHPGTHEPVGVINLLSVEGLHKILLMTVKNFTNFAPLGIVIVAMLGIGIAEKSGLISALIKNIVLASPARLLTFVVLLAGILSNLASSVGYVLLVPLGGIIFHAKGRHPILGMAVAFAGVAGGYSANLIIGTIDPLLAGLTEEAAKIMAPDYTVNPMCNYYFMVVSTFLIAAAGTFITEKFVAPQFGEYKGEVEETVSLEKLNRDERKGLRWALYITLVVIAIILSGTIPAEGFLRGEGGSLLKSPLLKGVVPLLFFWTALCGIAYGIATKKFKNDSDVMKTMADSAKSLGGYIVLVFFASQFVAYFNWSNLGIVLAVKGANLIESTNMGLIPVMLMFLALSGFINLLMGSASAKWALLAPIFVPMFMKLGYSPELTQVVYRIGDSVTNVISPMMSFFALIIAFFQKYDSKAGIGTVVSTMLPYSIGFFIVWAIMLVVWLWLGLPLGPAGGLTF